MREQDQRMSVKMHRGNKTYRWGNWMQLLNGFCRTADLSEVQRTPKQVGNQDSMEKQRSFVFPIFLLDSRTELGLEGKDVTDFCQESIVSPAWSRGRGH